MNKDYKNYLNGKIKDVVESGFDIEFNNLHPILFDYQKHLVKWALKIGKCALFTNTGTGKTIMQCEYARQLIINNHAKNVLIVAPLAVSQQTVNEAEKLEFKINNLRFDPFKEGCNIINYEQLHNIDASVYDAVVLDESSILKNFNSKTKQLIIDMFAKTKYKLACTATPAPNDFMELGNHAEFLNVMSRKEMLSMYFIHDSAHTQSWRLKGHAEDIFWKFVSTWAAIMTNPSDLGFDDSHYILPKLNIINKEVITNVTISSNAGIFNNNISLTLSERSKVRRLTTSDRVKEVASIVNNSKDTYLVWCDLNYESEMLSKSIPDAYEIKGSDSPEYKEKTMLDFAKGKIRVLVSKPSICGFGMNFQICHNVVFVGMSDSWEQYYQSVRRCWRFGQKNDVNVYIVVSSQEGAVLENINRKEQQALEMIKGMISHTKKYVMENIKYVHKVASLNNHTKKIVLPNFIKGE